jgi:methylated-DNA-[protein]-cysteine S-methyltransferase
MKSRRGLLSDISNDNNITEFERRVYRAVLKIPEGELRSYKWVARRIGRPKAFRAVGNALKRNNRAPAIPCHRVVRSDGSIGGYSKGLKLKRALLRSEGIDTDRAPLL